MSIPPAVSPSIVIMTREELREREAAAFKRGVERGRFEEGMDRAARHSAAPGERGHSAGAVDNHGTQAQLAGGPINSEQ